MPDWDEDSPQLVDNLRAVVARIREDAAGRVTPSIAAIREWHARMMRGLDCPRTEWVGNLRGDPAQPGLVEFEVHVGGACGVPASAVGAAVAAFESRLQRWVADLDSRVPSGSVPDEKTILEVVAICGWAHAEWVRVHPFANGNGRTARLLANSLAVRYSLPPFIRLRPRPAGNAYALAARLAMEGKHAATVDLFSGMLHEHVRQHGDGGGAP